MDAMSESVIDFSSSPFVLLKKESSIVPSLLSPEQTRQVLDKEPESVLVNTNMDAEVHQKFGVRLRVLGSERPNILHISPLFRDSESDNWPLG